MRVDTTVVETNIHYPTDSGLLTSTRPGSDAFRASWRPTPHSYSAANERAAKAKGVKRRVRSRSLHQEPGAQARAEEALVPPGPKMAHRMRGHPKRRQAPNGWPNRCRYKGDAGMKRWVGLGVIADTSTSAGALDKQAGS